MSKHTEGPWQSMPEEVDKPYIRIRGTRLGCRYKIANVLSCGEHELSADEVRANARLIAAAPDLLSALSKLLDASEGHPMDYFAKQAARLALAKAGAA